MRKNILKEIFDNYIEKNGNGASEQIFRSKENGKTYRVAFEKYTENGVMNNSVIKLVNIDDKTDEKAYTAFGSIDINGDCVLEPLENTIDYKELEDGVFLTNGEIVFAYKKTDDTIRGYHSYVSVYIYDSTPMSRMSNAFVFNKDKVCLNDICYPYSKKLRKATPDEIEEFRGILDSYGYVYTKDHEVLFKTPIEEGEYINISGISINGEKCYFISAQTISSPLMKTVLVVNDDYTHKDALSRVVVDGLITRVDKTIGDAFFAILNQKDVYWDSGLKSFVVKETPKEKLDEINHFKNTYVKRLEEIWEDEKKKAVERTQRTRELLKKKVVDDTNGEVKFSEVKKVFDTDNTSDDSKGTEQTYGRVTTKIINLIKNTPLTNEELKKINDVVFDAILSNTSKGAENGKRNESQRN